MYEHRGLRRRIPASNEKLLLSMALLERLDPGYRIETTAAVSSVVGGIVPGDLWVLGHGDPTIAGGGRYAEELEAFGATRLGRLARHIKAAGITRIQGSIVGGTGYFEHDWWAPGWEADFPAEEVALPSALTFDGNRHAGRHIADPELRAAAWLTKKLRSLGVQVWKGPRAGRPPEEKTVVATTHSQPLEKLMRFMNRNSANFFAEVLGKRLAVETYPGWGSIARGAAAIESFARRHGVKVQAYDSSGLSYGNRVSAVGLTRLLHLSAEQPWGKVLRSTLPGAGEGTLEERLAGVRLRAKTGTLDGVSALTGWIWLRRSGTWGEFSILSRGMDKSTAAHMEDRIATIVSLRAGPRSSEPVRTSRASAPAKTVLLALYDWLHRPLV